MRTNARCVTPNGRTSKLPKGQIQYRLQQSDKRVTKCLGQQCPKHGVGKSHPTHVIVWIPGANPGGTSALLFIILCDRKNSYTKRYDG